MTEPELAQSAARLPVVPPDAALAYALHQDELAAFVSARLLARSDIRELTGPANVPLMLQYHRNHVKYIRSMLVEFDPKELVKAVCWAIVTYRSHGFQSSYWPHQADAWIDAVSTVLPARARRSAAPLHLAARPYGLFHQHKRSTDFRQLT